MDPSQQSTRDGALTRIQEWNITIDQPDPRSLASRLVTQCLAVFKNSLKGISSNAQVTKKLFRQFEKSYSSLILWDAGYGIGQGKLDESIAHSRTLRLSILEPLVSISNIILHRLIPHLDPGDLGAGASSLLEDVAAEAEAGLHESYSDSSDSDYSGSDEGDGKASISASCDWDEVAEDLWTDIRCLLDLDLLIKSPIPDSVSRSHEDTEAIVPLKPHLPYVEKITNRFPTAEATLIDRLASANLVRYRENKEAREKNRAIGTDLELSCSESVSKFHDSGVGTSLHTASVYAETVMSFRREGQKSVSIPPLSAEAKRGEPFDCIACGKKLHITNNSAWKKHLYLDLRPWICYDPSCNYSAKLFEDRESWIQHLALDHRLEPEWKSLGCPLCRRATGDGRSAVSQHLSAHLEEISLAALPLDVDCDDEDDSNDDSAHEAVETEQKFENQWAKEESESKWRCLYPGCDKLFRAKHYLKKHVDNRHPGWLDDLATRSSVGTDPVEKEGSKAVMQKNEVPPNSLEDEKWICLYPECREVFEAKHHLDNHVQYDHSNMSHNVKKKAGSRMAQDNSKNGSDYRNSRDSLNSDAGGVDKDPHTLEREARDTDRLLREAQRVAGLGSKQRR